jgi:YesN/AraC family two-component response regulator
MQRLKPGNKTPAIVIISGIDPNKFLEKAAAVGVYSFLPKPIEKAKLLKVVADALK